MSNPSSDRPMTAMILAAGRGERLKPITNIIPKALCMVAGKPLIEHHVDNLACGGFKRIVINHAYLGSQIRRCLGDGSKWGLEICYIPEPPGSLETGGAIYNALSLLGGESFITINADIFTNYNFSNLSLTPDNMVKFVLSDSTQTGDFGIDERGNLTNERHYVFTGIACYHPSVFNKCQIGRYSVVPLVRALAEQKQASGELFQGAWIDVGVPERLQKLTHRDRTEP